MRKFLSSKRFSAILSACFWIAVWQIVSMAVANSITIASPVDTLRALAGLISTSLFWQSIWNTALKIVFGFLAAALFGIILAAASSAVPIIKSLFMPLANVIKATPVASFTIMALLWIRSEWLPCFISFLMAMPLIFINVVAGIASADTKLLEAAHIFGAPFAKKAKNIYFPAAMPYFCSACSAGIGLCWKAGVAAEVIVQPRNTIGEQLYYSKLYLDTPQLFAYTAVIILISVIFEKLFIVLLNRLSRHYERGASDADRA